MKPAARWALVVVFLTACASGNDNNNNTNQEPDAGPDAGGPAPVLQSVSPSSGPLGGGTTVTLTGENFRIGMLITFDGQPCTYVQVTANTQAACITPAGAAVGAVTVRVETPDTQSSQLNGAFTYEEDATPEITWCVLSRPATLATDTATATPPIYGQVFAEDVTDRVGQGANVTAELGFGPTGTDPASSSAWTWVTAVYSSDASVNNDEYVASLSVGVAGDYDYAYRFTLDGGAFLYCDLDDSDNGYSSLQAGALSVTGPTTLTVTGVDLPRGTALGGDTVTVTGTGFSANTAVLFGTTASPTVTFVSETELTAVTPAGAVGAADVTVQDTAQTDSTLSGGFEYLLVFSPTVDGNLSDWDGTLRIATNSVTSDWGTNELTELYVAYDANNLYLGITGTVGTDNAIVGYLDVDFGQSTGLSNMANITDGTGNIDAALSGALVVSASGYGAEFAFASKEMAEVINGLEDAAGWRGLSNPADMPWITGTVDAGSGALELSVPLASLWTGGVPAGGVEAALVVKIGNFEGNDYANQTLPEEDTAATVSQVVTFRVYPSGAY